MKYLLFVVSVLVGLGGILISAMARTAIHEIHGAVMLLIAAVLFTGAAIVSSVDAVEDRLKELLNRPPR